MSCRKHHSGSFLEHLPNLKTFNPKPRVNPPEVKISTIFHASERDK